MRHREEVLDNKPSSVVEQDDDKSVVVGVDTVGTAVVGFHHIHNVVSDPAVAAVVRQDLVPLLDR